MFRIVKMWFLVLSFAILPSSYASDLTEESVRNIISKIDNAISTLNAQEVADSLSDNVEITMHISMQGQNQVLKPSKQEYISMLRQGWEQYTDYKYSRSNMVIEIKGNKAFVSADLQESMAFQGQSISGGSKEEVIIEFVNGAPLITKVTGYTSM